MEKYGFEPIIIEPLETIFRQIIHINEYLEVASTSIFTGEISAHNIYTQTEVNNLLVGRAPSSDISSKTSKGNRQFRNIY